MNVQELGKALLEGGAMVAGVYAGAKFDKGTFDDKEHPDRKRHFARVLHSLMSGSMGNSQMIQISEDMPLETEANTVKYAFKRGDLVAVAVRSLKNDKGVLKGYVNGTGLIKIEG
jgi:hypothetical protein